MQRRIQRMVDVFQKFTLGGATLTMTGLFLIVFINSVRRYTIGKSLEWGEELPVFIAIYGVMFGMAVAYIQDKHIRFTILVGFLSKEWTRRLYILVDLIMIINGVLLTYSGWTFAAKRGGVEASGIINLAKSFVSVTGIESLIWMGHQYPYQFAMAIGGVLLTIAAFLKFLLRIIEKPAPTQS